MEKEPGGPAARADLETGDVIVHFAGEWVAGIDALHRLLGADRVGQSAPQHADRRGQLRDFAITPVEMAAR